MPAPRRVGGDATAAAGRASSSSYETCALVSSSGQLQRAAFGAAIDSNDLVARFGAAPTRGYETDVGSSTHARLLSTAVALGKKGGSRANLTELAAQLQDPRLRHVIWFHDPTKMGRATIDMVASFARRTDLRHTIILQRSECGSLFTSHGVPTVGVLALEHAFAPPLRCKQVHLFGFWPAAQTNASAPYHYWRDGSQHDGATIGEWYRARRDKRMHDFDSEHAAMARLSDATTAGARSQQAGVLHVTRRVFEESCGATARAKKERLQAVARLRPSTAPFLVLPSFWSREQAAAARQQVVDAQALCHDVGEGGDTRTMGISDWARRHPDRFPLITAFETDPLLRSMAARHLGKSRVAVTTLAGATAAGQASGGGWHKDSKHRGFKALIYLDDVREEATGPFAMLLNYTDSMLRSNADRRNTRYDAEDVQRHAQQYAARVEPIYGPAGTVVVFETSSVHRGMPCTTGGGRVTLTNYYENSLRVCAGTGSRGRTPG